MSLRPTSKKILKNVNGVHVLLLALVVRLAYCFFIAPRQLCGLNDHLQFELGASVSAALRTGNIQFLALPMQQGSFETAPSLIELLVNAGPLHHIYLGSLLNSCGLGGTLDASRVDCSFIVAANCVVDAIACVFIYYAARIVFNKRAGLLAAILAIFYPSAVLNDMQCCPETLAFALNALWLCLASVLTLKRVRKMTRLATLFLIGAVSVSIGLCVPALMPLPFIAGAAMTALELQRRAPMRNPVSFLVPALCLCFGATILWVPWYQIQIATLGKFQPFSVAALTEQLWIGNMLTPDGWRTIPQPIFLTVEFTSTVKRFLKSLMGYPISYSALLCQKIPRLWVGGWNDYNATFFAIPPIVCQIWQQWIILLAFLGAAFTALHHARWRHSRALICLVALSIFVAYHALFSLFSPLSRNAHSAIPALIILAAAGVELLWRHRQTHNQTVLLLAVSALIFCYLAAGSSFVPFILAMGVSDAAARIADIAIIIAGWVLLASLALKIAQGITGAEVSIASDMIKAGCVVSILITIGSGYADQHWREWHADLKTNHDAVIQKIHLPAAMYIPDLDTAKIAFVLFDASADALAPPIVAEINGVPSDASPIPWLLLHPQDPDSFKVIQTQSLGMGRDWRSLRQWWALPVPISSLKFGEDNIVSLSLKNSDQPSTASIYGQLGSFAEHQNKSGSIGIVPSWRNLSWEKGFGTIEKGDMRLFDTVILQGKIVDSGFSNGTSTRKGDLSYEHGVQGGAYRIRLAVPIRVGFLQQPEPPIEPEKATEEIAFPFMKEEAHTVSGTDSESQTLTGNGCDISGKVTPQSMVEFRCELKGYNRNLTGEVRLELSGQDEFGEPILWSSPWQPRCLSLRQTWTPYSQVELLPDQVARARNLKLSIKIVPYDEASLLLHPRVARSQQLAVRRATLEVTAPLPIFRPLERDWLVF